MALTKISSGLLADDAISTASLADGIIQAAHLHSSHGITTSNIAEGSNEYHTTARARAAVSVGGSLAYNSSTGVVSFTQRTDGTIRGLVSVTDSGGDGSLAYNNSTGVITYTGPSASEVRAHLSAGTGMTFSGGEFATTITQYTEALVRADISVTDSGGDGSLAYNNSTGVITYTGPSAAEVRAHLSAGTGVTYSGGAISIGQSVATSATPTFGNTTLTGYLRGPSSFTIDPATHGDDTGTVVIAGNLQVDGTTTTINSTTVAIDDLNFSIATDAADSAAANGAGITIGGASATMLYTHATTSWDFNKPVNVTGNIGVSGTVDGVDIAARDAILTSTTTTAGAALPKAGGTMSGALNMGSQNISAINNATAVSFLSTNGYWVGGTQRMNGSGNLLNIGTINTTGNLTIDSAGSAAVTLDRASTSTGSTIDFKTAGTLKWYMGLRGLTNDNWYLRDEVGSTNALTVTSGGNLSVAGAIGAGDGTASLPSLSFAGDTNTGLFLGNADQLNFAIGGQDKAFFSATQLNVSAKVVATELDINGNADVSGTLGVTGLLTATAGITTPANQRIQASSGMLFLSGASAIAFENGAGSEKMRLSSGKLLIGDLVSHTSDLLQIETPASGGGHGIQIRRNDANTDQGIGHILFGNNTATDLVKISAKTDGDSNAGDSGALLFHTQVTGGNLTQRMEIDSNGKVGIGTAATLAGFRLSQPTTGEWAMNVIHAASGGVNYGLSVDTSAGAANTVGAFQVYPPTGNGFMVNNYSRVGIGTTAPATDLQIGDYTDNAETITIATASDQTGRINFYNNNASEGASMRVTGGGAGAKMYFANRYDADVDRVTFDLVNGKVGIGTTDPSTNLDVYDNADGWTSVVARDAAKAAFTGVYKIGSHSSPGIFAHSSALNAWEDLYLNAHKASNGTLAGGTQKNVIIAGNVGIGTTSPATPLDVLAGSTGSSPYTATAITMAPSNFPARTWQLRMDDGGAAGYGFSIAAAGNRVLYLNNNNKVGINEVSPDGTLHITQGSAGSVTASGDKNSLVVENSTHGGVSVLTPDASEAGYFTGHPSGNRTGEWHTRRDTNKMRFGSRNSGMDVVFYSGNWVNNMTLFNTGQLGVNALNFGGAGTPRVDSSSISQTSSGANLFYNADGEHTFRTYDGGWVEKMKVSDVGATFKASNAGTGQTHVLYSSGQVTMADDATITLSGVTNTGALISIGSYRKSGQNVCYAHGLIFLGYNIGTAGGTIIADPTGFLRNSDTDGYICVYKAQGSGTVTVKNRLGIANAVSITIHRYLGL